MRLTSELFVAALVRRVFADGNFAAVERRGASAAGAVFVCARARDGSVRLFGPAPQTLAEPDGERRFTEERIEGEEGLARRLEREARFDPDFWLVDIEVAEPERYLTVAAGD